MPCIRRTRVITRDRSASSSKIDHSIKAQKHTKKKCPEAVPLRDNHPELTYIKCKLNQLQGEPKNMQSGRSEHPKHMKNPRKYDIQVRKLKQDVAVMKKRKVALVTKLQGESRRHLEAEKLCKRKIAKMIKLACRQRTISAPLRNKTANKEMVLKWRHEKM
ncbi:hypothetical protein MRX96_035276 [Rhipicephalus microplus]